jgi:aerobic carbon-monoxide dehydrogenase small subunit
MLKTRVTLVLNGESVSAEIEPRETLADFIRERQGLTATHLGCEHGVCGACTVEVDGQTTRSCLCLAVKADGADVRTLEGLAADPAMMVLKRWFHDEHALQCGFCTPGMLTTLIEFLRDNPDPTEREVRVAISGNLCRCTGYQGIVLAALDAAKRMKAAKV